MRLPRRGSKNVRIRAGEHEELVRADFEGPEADVQMDGGEAFVAYPSFFEALWRGAASFDTPDAATAEKRYDIEISGGSSEVTIEDSLDAAAGPIHPYRTADPRDSIPL